ncbi:MAG: hypothetical protein J6T70_02770 [Bacteroidales bacterium]|nr:hypothetical protein [Bacteroidales bacterium]
MNTQISDNENVARAIFSPQMINSNGELLLAAFALRVFKDGGKEDYISVSRMSITTWMSDIKNIPQYTNRRLYGYSVLNVGEIRSINLMVEEHPIIYDVIDYSNAKCPSHAGITTKIDDNTITGGHNALFDTLQINEPEDFVLMAIQSELLSIAKVNLIRF